MDLTIICEFSEVSFSDNTILGALSVIFFFKRIWYIVAITAEQMLPIRSQNQLFIHQQVTVHRYEVGRLGWETLGQPGISARGHTGSCSPNDAD